MLKLSVERNPGKNNSIIKKTFLARLNKNLVNKIFRSPKFILKITKVDLKRLQKKLKYTITAQPLWKLVDEKEQV